MGRKINYTPAAQINARDLRNSLLKEARDLNFISNLSDTSFTRSLIETKEATGNARYYSPIKAVSDGALIYILMSNNDSDTAKNGIVALDAFSLEVVATAYGMFSMPTMVDIIVDENNLYVLGSGTMETEVYKCDKLTLQVSSTYVETFFISSVHGICFSGANIFLLGTFEGVGGVRKIDKATMVGNATKWLDIYGIPFWTAIAARSNYFYVATKINQALVIKVEIATMTLSAVWQGAVGENNAMALDLDGTSLYVALSAATAIIKKIDFVTMTTTGSYDLGAAAANDIIAISQTSTTILALIANGAGTGNWMLIQKSDMSGLSTGAISDCSAVVQVIAVKIWQHFITQQSAGNYYAKKVPVGIYT